MTADAAARPQGVRFGTFTGVFTPTLLTILGVIMYVRLPWLVGNAGLLGAWLIMGLAMGITACTGLSLSSIATNTRIGAGGPYAIIHKSLGFEVGGSIGIPLYLTRPLGTAMYIFGFREGWQWIFPEHPALAIDLSVFLVLFLLAFKGADIAFRVQFFVMAIIVVSLVSAFGSPALRTDPQPILYWGQYPGFPENGFGGISAWGAVAVFFPATTGILAGANMSGDLADPRRAIAHGTLWAIGISSIIYFALAWVAARIATPAELQGNYTILMDRALWGPAVLAGLLGATFSSALAGSVGGPRILMAMAEHKILPRSKWLAHCAADGEPRNAVLVTAVLTLAALMMRDLNAIAPLLTMFFLITYSVINVVLLVEQTLGLVSFRPTLRVHWIVPLLGTLGGVFTMFVINPTFGLISVVTVVGIYVWVLRLGLVSHGDNVRSSVFVAMAEWAAARVSEFDKGNVRAWKPNLLVPFEDPAQVRGEFRFILDTAAPEGSVKLLGLATSEAAETLRPRVERLADAFRRKEIFANWSVVDSPDFTSGVVTGLQALQSAFFRPNVLFLTAPDNEERHPEYGQIIRQARRTGVGILLLAMHPRAGFGVNNVVNVWVREQPLWDIDEAFKLNNLNLSLLMAYRLRRAWNAELNLVSAVANESSVEAARAFLDELVDLARLPAKTNREIRVGTFPHVAALAPACDLSIVGLGPEPDFDFVRQVTNLTRATCLFVADSGRESARA